MLYDSPIDAPADKGESTRVYVENCDCLVSALAWKELGYRVAVLNMASRRKPGGGVLGGAGAQEENIFRRSDLFMSLYGYSSETSGYGADFAEQGYPLDRDLGGIYSPGVSVFRGPESDGYPLLEQPFLTLFVSVTGMNRPDLDREGMIALRLR